MLVHRKFAFGVQIYYHFPIKQDCKSCAQWFTCSSLLWLYGISYTAWPISICPSSYWFIIRLAKAYYHYDSLYSFIHQILLLPENRSTRQRWQWFGWHVGWAHISQQKINALYHRLQCTCVDVISLKPVTIIGPTLADRHKNHKCCEALPADTTYCTYIDW